MFAMSSYTEVLNDWLSPQGVIALGVVYGIAQGMINSHKLRHIEKSTNGMQATMLAATAKASKLEGNVETLKEQKAQQDTAATLAATAATVAAVTAAATVAATAASPKEPI